MTLHTGGRKIVLTSESMIPTATILVVLLWVLTSAATTRERSRHELEKDFDDELNITSKEKALIKKLIDRYHRQGKEGRPVVNTSDAVRVEFGLSLIQILDVDVKNQVLKTNVWYEYTWHDVLLKWDQSQYENIPDVRIPPDKIWMPDILLYNFCDDRLKEQRNALVVVYSDGMVLWMPQAILRSSCAFDTFYFPFDEQICILKFGSWTYNGLQLDIHFKANREMFEMGSYIENNDWNILENSGHRNIKKYACCPEPYPDLKFKIRLQRRVAFYIFTLIIPCALLSLLTTVIFWIPPESPAKLTLGMSIFLAFFVLLLLLAESTPKAATSIPLIGSYFCLNMIMITMSEILACMVANMHFRGVRINKVPKYLRLIMIDFMARVLRIRDKILDTDTPPHDCSQSKKRWNLSRVGGKTSKPPYPYTDYSFAQVRLLSTGDDKPEQRREGEDRGGGCSMQGFKFPRIVDDSLSHSQVNLQILDEVRCVRELLEKVRDKRATVEEKDKLAREWRVIAIVTDRIIFAVYVLVNLIGLFVIFIWQLNREELTVKGFDDL